MKKYTELPLNPAETPESRALESDTMPCPTSDEARQIAVAGYMADRSTLIKKFAQLNPYFTSELKQCECIGEELARIDVAVLVLLSLPSNRGTSYQSHDENSKG